jgi:hypothetical protein
MPRPMTSPTTATTCPSPSGDVPAGNVGSSFGQERALQVEGGLTFRRVRPRAQQVLGSLCRERQNEGSLVLVEQPSDTEAESQRTQRAVPDDEWDSAHRDGPCLEAAQRGELSIPLVL